MCRPGAVLRPSGVCASRCFGSCRGPTGSAPGAPDRRNFRMPPWGQSWNASPSSHRAQPLNETPARPLSQSRSGQAFPLHSPGRNSRYAPQSGALHGRSVPGQVKACGGRVGSALLGALCSPARLTAQRVHVLTPSGSFWRSVALQRRKTPPRAAVPRTEAFFCAAPAALTGPADRGANPGPGTYMGWAAPPG